VRADTPSFTALWVAAARQLGMLLHDDVRLAEDPYGAAFGSTIPGRIPGLLAKTRATRRLVMMPGIGTWVSYMQVRTRVLDDLLRAFVAAHPTGQVVLLGAGYDCRALRLPELANHPVFEIDHPSTQSHKRSVLARLGADSPARYLAWDFESRPMSELPRALALHGFRTSAPAFTIWEGVTMYLTEPAIDASLRAIRVWSDAPGSQLALTYFTKQRLEHPSLASRMVRTVVRGAGEPFRWAWNPEELPGYLAARGFTVLLDRSMNDAAHELLPPKLAELVHNIGSRYALAQPLEQIAVATS
jgi:methyltransferase (TIGR00027 family)